ncbi:P-loop containing nucleoside triphosphate hydrolase protein [Halteromyces radiatus]|uniref:P-loop containing nucleoside triphosphate hydrolase protein n=1 Tax=Halteromyces radiatus TaxID=101107 RepID=UPI0022201A1D|nr:P-loop containing nucleoside triphosphate hydrolase protein [Halteromyces radiatus]KAI8098944.1 P-loop containing nucleoside triphosphate hydrolase protein [Halteromyces radiatus]
MSLTAASQAVDVYTKGTKAWFTDEKLAWVSATCILNETSGDTVKLIFEGDADQKEYVFESTLSDIQKNDGANLPPLRNPPKLEFNDDLTNLSYLNEPGVLNTIRTRYMQRLIYTYSGIVLIAMNPFDRVALYDPDIVQQYSGKRRGELEPHLFAIAEDAYRCMIREQSNQTIVVSGESGAGKTVSAKYIMRYFATADDQESTGKRKKTDGSMTEVEEQILATNPIMEAFGNAKTTRNDNSSRFGKYIEIQFDDGANIIGAKIRTYLLERSRLIFQPETERNYHIFYQLCAGAPSSEKKKFELGTYSDFHYLNQSGTGTIPGVNDADEFEVTQKALSTVGLSVELQWKIFQILAALLHVGNIQITGRGDAMLMENDPALLTATRLLGIKTTEFRKWIVRKQIVTRSEKIVTNLNPAQATVVKDSVAKYVYSNLFDWLVGVTNDSLSCGDPNLVATFIGVLDIYGFEHFKKNSFEQFCINYANEKLQQQFNQHVFKLEQEEYVREQINWTFIEFSDNQKCIELIEGKLGILSLLDEESRLPAGSDQGFSQKLYTNFDKPEFKSHFKKPRFSNNAFTIAHYAHDVQYEAENFLDKNKDSVPDEHMSLLQATEFDFLKEVLDKAASNNPAPTPQANKRMSMIARKPTLGSIFKLSLINLMDTIGGTNVHYIRCIKPNEAKVAWEFEPNMVLSQLRACGVLETIRISCAGYPSRWTFEEFADRYYALVPSKHWDTKSSSPDVRTLCSTILDKSIQEEDKYQVGTTKIFFRAGQLAYLEKLRSDRYDECATLLQKHMRRFVYRTRYMRMRDLVLRLQCIARSKLAQAQLKSLQEEHAAITVQKHWRRYTARKEFLAKKTFVFKLQTAIRGHIARRDFSSVKENQAAIQIQCAVRGWFARRYVKTQLGYVTLLQSCIRRRVAQKQLMDLRKEARSVSHFKEVSYKLESKVVELTQTVTGLTRDKKALNDRTIQLESQIKTWTEKYDKLDKKNKELESKLQLPTVPQQDWDTLQAERDSLTKENQSTLTKFDTQARELAKLTSALSAEKETNAQLQSALEEARQQNALAVDETEVAELKNQIAGLKAQLAQMMNAPRRQQSNNNIRGLSPAGGYRDTSASPGPRNMSASPMKPLDAKEHTERQRSRSPHGLVNRKARRNSAADVADTRPKTSIDNVRKAEQLSKNPRPTSLAFFGSLLGNKAGGTLEGLDGDPEEAIHNILRDEEALHDEVLEGLIKTLKMPLPNMQNPPSQKEVVFPAHVIGIIVIEMWKLGYIEESERLLFSVMDTIQKQCLGFTGEEATVPCAFWLTNIHELLSLVCRAEQDLERDLHGNSSWHEFEKLMATIKFEMQCLEDNIFHAWMKEAKKRLSKMVVPSVIENQSLPGFVTADNGRFFNKFLTGSSQPSFSMDELLHFLNKLYRTMKCYYLEQSVATQILTEILKMIGVSAFNDLLMRKNFASWKRAMQIQYNITRIEEWCKSHDIPEGTLQLEHLMQSTKLLQFKKNTLEDIDNIYDVCWILSPTQIQKLISNYLVADYENPISPDILKAVADHIVSGDQSDVLLLDSVAIDDTTNPFEIPIPRHTKPQKYLPAWLNLPRLRRLTILLDTTPQKDTDNKEQGVETTMV